MTSVECESLDDGLRRVTPGQERTADPPNSAHAGVNTQAVPFEKGRANAHRPLCIPCRPDPSNGITVSWPDCTRVCHVNNGECAVALLGYRDTLRLTLVMNLIVRVKKCLP